MGERVGQRPRRLNRRQLLYEAVVAATGAILTACENPFWTKLTPTPQPSGPPATPPEGESTAVPPAQETVPVPNPSATSAPSATTRPTETPYVSKVIVPTAEGHREGVPLSVKFEVIEDQPGTSLQLEQNLPPTLSLYVEVITQTTMDIITTIQRQQGMTLSAQQKLQIEQQRLQIEQQMFILRQSTTANLLGGSSSAEVIPPVATPLPAPNPPKDAIIFSPARKPGVPFTAVFEISEDQPSGALKETVRDSLRVYSRLAAENAEDVIDRMQRQKGNLTDQQKATFDTQVLSFRQNVSQILLTGGPR